MIQDVRYELTAFIITLIVLFNLRIKKNVKTFANRMFQWFVISGIADIFFDILTTVMISYPDAFPLIAKSLALEIFYVLQLVMPYLLYLYVLSLRDFLRIHNIRYLLLYSAGFAAQLINVLLNPATKILYYFTDSGVYYHGSHYYTMYLYAFFYLSLTLIDTVLYRQRINKRYIHVIWEFAIISAVCLCLQLWRSDILFIGVGISISLIVMMITINNPFEKTDGLTGLFDIAALKDTLVDYYGNAIPCYLIIIACDRLKRINLAFGMENGNRLLQIIATKLVDIVGKDHAFRFIGDRFVLLCTNRQSYQSAMRELQNYFNRPFFINNISLNVSVCICGVATPSALQSPDQLMDFADYLIAKAKLSGSGTVLESTELTVQEYNRRKQIETYLFEAVHNNLFTVHYQPIYSMTEEKFVSAEALVRLSHPQLGMISPAEFIPIAESSGEISQVEDCILHVVCTDLRNHPEVFCKLQNIKVNLSAAMFLNLNLSRRLLDRIRSYDLDPAFFQFEITETAATIYGEETLRWAMEMKAAGSQLCLDDFGSGYANLDAVMKLPFDVVKIDRSVLIDAGNNAKSAILYENIVNMLHQLNFMVVAEGAETEADIAFLQKVGIRYVQGFYFARPMAVKGLCSLLEQANRTDTALI